ncbi:hypothetical protein CSB09_04240 [Candidatus Gracilibacteria bacterium]|nr:MAG: hypothetical protein CSB09_04240 [Candidatus Gracilibacteria bacterium]
MIGLIIVVSIVIYGIINHIYMMSIAAFLMAGSYLLIENNTTPTMEVEMEEGMMKINGNIYEFKDFVYFGMISKNANEKMLRFVPRSKLATFLDIPVTQDVNPIELREWLSTQLEENPNLKMTQADKIIQMTKL